MMKSLFIALLFIIAYLHARAIGPLFRPHYYYSRSRNNGSRIYRPYYSRDSYYSARSYRPHYSRNSYYSSEDDTPNYSGDNYYSSDDRPYYSSGKYYSSEDRPYYSRYNYYSSEDDRPYYSSGKYYSSEDRPYYSRYNYYSSEDDVAYYSKNSYYKRDSRSSYSRSNYYSSDDDIQYYSRYTYYMLRHYMQYNLRYNYSSSEDDVTFYSRNNYYRSTHYRPYYSNDEYYSSEDDISYYSRHSYHNSRNSRSSHSSGNYYSSDDDIQHYSRYNYYRPRHYIQYSRYNYSSSENDLTFFFRYNYPRSTRYIQYYLSDKYYSSEDDIPDYSRYNYRSMFIPYYSSDNHYSSDDDVPYYSRQNYSSESDIPYYSKYSYYNLRDYGPYYSSDKYYSSEDVNIARDYRSRVYSPKDDYYGFRHFGANFPQHRDYAERDFEFQESVLPEPLKEDVPCTDPDSNLEEYRTVKEFPMSKVNDSNIVISIITSTYTPRHKFHKNLYFAFLKQKIPENYYPIPKWNENEIELLVYDNWYSEDDKQEIHPSPFFTAEENLDKTGKFKDRRVKYKFFNYSMSIGEKRNIMAREAKGKYVIHMDDDDFFDTDYVADSLNTLLSYDENTILVIRLKYFQYDVTWNTDLQKIESNYFYVNSRRKSENWAFAWVYKNEPFQFYMNTEHEPCTYEHTSFAEEDIMSQCLEMKQPGSVAKHQKLSTAFVKIDTGFCATSAFRPSINVHEATLIEMKVNYASEVNALMNGYYGYCKLLNHVESSMRKD